MAGAGSPRASTLLRAVQRGDYGALANLLSSSNRDHQEENTNLGLLAALLVEASGREHLDCIELLLQKMMKPSPKRNLKRRGCFPMHTAAGAGAIESIELLLSAGLSPKTRDHSGRTPLHLAAAQGSAECVSFLCTVARSTVLAHDRATGDTPLHFAVRARHGVCIEVLLLNSRGVCDILLEANDKGETPIDIATALGDTSLVLRSESALARGGGTACLQGGVDIERIMAVWERFFENAAMASVGGGNMLQASDDPLFSNQHDEYRRNSNDCSRDTTVVREGNSSYQLASGNRHAAASRREGDRLLDRNGKLMPTGIALRDRGSSATMGWVSGEWASGERRNKKGDGGVKVHESGLAGRHRGVGTIDRHLSRLTPSLPAIESTRYCAWEATPADHLPDKMEEDFDVYHHASPPQQCIKERRSLRLETEAPFTLSDDTDLHLFRTPTGDNDVGELWISESRAESGCSSREPPVEGKNSGNLLHHQAWVACWDAASESTYYWNSESGELTWNTPSPAIPFTEEHRLDRFLSCVWDPQQEAYFSIDGDGVSRWVTEDEAEDGAACTTTFSCQAASDYSRAFSTWQISFESGQQGSEAGSQSIENGRARDRSHVVGSAKDKEGPTENTIVTLNSEPELQGVDLCQHPLPEATRQVHNYNDEDNVHGFFDTEEGSSRCLSHSTPPAHPRQEAEVVIAHEQSPPEPIAMRSSTPATSNGSPRGENRSEDGEFFDTRTWEGHHQLSAWVMWCTQPSLNDDDDTPPYFVNEETFMSSWVLPPEAVATSNGWVRAWSEEHQARFYANQWTGRVTWDIEDLEAEGWLTVKQG